MSSWRGQPLTQEVAESLFIGWKEAGLQMPDGAVTKRYSWLIAGGKNAAYDHFPCQVGWGVGWATSVAQPPTPCFAGG